MSPRATIFLNPRSGSAGGLRQQIVDAFGKLGLPCEVVSLQPGVDVTDLAREAARIPDTAVVSAGGDGTVNAIASAVVGTGSAMGVIPAGTLNHFARDLEIPLELDRAISIIAQQHRSTVDTGEVNGHVFVNNSSVGIYPEMVTERDQLGKRGVSKWLSLVLASAHALLRFRCILVQLTVDGQTFSRYTPILFVGNNQYRVEGTHIGTRDRLDRGSLFVYLTPDLTRFGMLRIALAALFGKVKDVPNYEQFSVNEFTVDLRHRVCKVAVDGELRRLKGPLRYRIRPSSLTVFTPGPG